MRVMTSAGSVGCTSTGAPKPHDPHAHVQALSDLLAETPERISNPGRTPWNRFIHEMGGSETLPNFTVVTEINMVTDVMHCMLYFADSSAADIIICLILVSKAV